MYNFFQRYPDLSLGKPEETSFSYATDFNRVCLEYFFFNSLLDCYSELCNKNSLCSNNVYNLDKNFLSTLQNPPNVIA